MELKSRNLILLFIFVEGNMSNWKNKHPEMWDQFDVACWVQSHTERLNLRTMCMDAFYGIDGQTMCRMSFEDFQSLDLTYGSELYLAFNHLLFTTQKYQESYIQPQPNAMGYQGG